MGHFYHLDPDPADQNQCGSIWIRIHYHNTVHTNVILILATLGSFSVIVPDGGGQLQFVYVQVDFCNNVLGT